MGDIMHGYEYYEAHAKDVKLEHITSDEDNADILASLRDDDPDFKDFSIVTDHEDGVYDFVVREGDHLGWVGFFVGKSKELETLSIVDFPDNINLNVFFEGLGRNRSIQELSIWADLGESFQNLIPFVRNNDSLHELRFGYFDIGLQCARNIALLSSQQSSLKSLTFEEAYLDGEGLKQIAKALRSQPIEELRLGSTNISVRDGYAALGKALESCLSLRMLGLSIFDPVDERLDDDGDIDDEDAAEEGLLALVARLKLCHDLTSLKLAGKLIITEEVSRSLSTLFQSDNCRLEYLFLGQLDIDDDGITALAPGLASLPSLKMLNLHDNSICDQGLQDLVGALAGCDIEALSLLSNMFGSVSGMRSLGTFVRGTTSMRSLFLGNCFITDEGLQSFVEGMANTCNLSELSLSHNNSITANGLASLSSLFRAEHCSLSDLDLLGINIGDDGAAALANGLIGNKSLTTLRVDNSSITSTARGWSAFSRLLCDTSSVNNTYLSNHTLVQVGDYDMQNTPSDVVRYLKMNESQNQDAAICKILHSHPDIDISPLFRFNLMCLPLAVEWFEKAESYFDKVNESPEVLKNRQLSAVYKFIRGMPLLAANGFRSQKMKDVQLQSELKSKKRKLDQTL